jgi:predicted nucleic acid-binding Zn ribbon protein
MNQDRRDAEAWAKEWYIRQKNRRLLMVLAGALLIAVLVFAV